MSILSFGFLVFLIISLLVYYLTPGKYQWISLLVVSYSFYLFAGVKAIIFILITTTSTYFAGLKIGAINDEYSVAIANYKGPNPKITHAEKREIKADEDKRKRWIVAFTLILNFGLLIVLKYMTPVVDALNAVCALFHLRYEVPYVSVIVPLGISYYTFQAMGYVIDLHRRKYAPEKHFGHFMLFVSFFPQLIQGPVNRFDTFSPRLLEPHRFDTANIRHGAVLLLWGLFKKLVISDRVLIMITTIMTAPEKYRGFYLAFGAFLRVLQLYTDFSGGIDMTRGVAEAFGIIMPENFTRPFFSRTFDEFWRRWHISMNLWWRDYVFYPLTLSKPLQKFGAKLRKIVGDNFSKKLPILIAVIICRMLNAVWHGSTYSNYAAGLFYGLILALSFYFEPHFSKWTRKLKINTECFSWKLYQCLRTALVFSIPYINFGAKSFSQAAVYLRNMFGEFNPWVMFDGSLYTLGVTQQQLQIVSLAILALLVVGILQEKGYSVREAIDNQNLVFQGIIYLVLIFSIILFGIYGAGYNASAFVYQMI